MGKFRDILKSVPGLQSAVKSGRELRKRLLLGPLWPVRRQRLMRQPRMSLNKFAALVLRPGDVVLDIGANAGEMSLLMASCVAPAGRVYAFEPQPDCFLELQRSAESAPALNLSAFSLALSDAGGPVTLLKDMRDGGGASTLMAAHADREVAARNAEFSPTPVTATTLDAFCEASALAPDFLKIDVEGAEELVIRGGRKTIAAALPLIWFECWGGLENGAQINGNLGHFAQLSAAGYKFFLATIFKLNDRWIPESDPVNPAQLLPFDPLMLESSPAMGADVLAAAGDDLVRLRDSGLISNADAGSHLRGFAAGGR
jgi:FkbM family methyltransferase